MNKNESSSDLIKGQKPCSRDDFDTYLELLKKKPGIRRSQTSVISIRGNKVTATWHWDRSEPLLCETTWLDEKTHSLRAEYYTGSRARKVLKIEEFAKKD